MQSRIPEGEGFSDSDWAGCKATMKSTSGGIVMIGCHLIKSWSSTQKSITLSSAEAELIAAVKMTAELIGVTQFAFDWNTFLRGRFHVDSRAAIGIANRSGNGKMRHVKVGNLWIQEKVADGDDGMRKIYGEVNPSDVLTKGLSAEEIKRFMDLSSQELKIGRADKSPNLR